MIYFFVVIKRVKESIILLQIFDQKVSVANHRHNVFNYNIVKI